MATKKPRMMGWQAAGAAPIVLGHPVDDPQTVASAIRIGNPASWRFAEAARDESGGAIHSVTDEEILEAYRLLAQEEGIFCEPASAACVAGLLKHAADRSEARDGRERDRLRDHGARPEGPGDGDEGRGADRRRWTRTSAPWKRRWGCRPRTGPTSVTPLAVCYNYVS